MLIIINRKKKKEKKTMFLSKISIHLGIMILYTIEKKFFFCRCTLQAFSTEEI